MSGRPVRPAPARLLILALGAPAVVAGLAACGGEEGGARGAAAAADVAGLTVGAPERIRGGTEPAWTPDGRLVFSAFLEGQRELYVRSADGSSEERLTVTPGYDMLPSVSVDGRLAYFEGDEAGVRLMLRDSLAGASRPVPLGELNVMLVRPAWAPDGRLTVTVSTGEGEADLVSVDPGGGAPRPAVADPGYDSQPAWSRDGLLAFVSRRGGSADVWVLAPSGDTMRLTGFEGSAQGPAWSPDGRFLVYVSATEEGRALYVAPSSGGELRRLVGGEGRLIAPAWSPDGRWIAYAIAASGRNDDDLMLLEVGGPGGVGR